MGFGTDVDRFLANFRQKADRAAQFYAEEAGLFIVDVTPVVTGKLVGGWYMRLNSADEFPSLPNDPTRVFTKALIRATAKKVRWGDVIELVNNVPYALYVDQGTLHFEGRQMIRQTIVYVTGLRPPT